jgi:hypothetical protein
MGFYRADPPGQATLVKNVPPEGTVDVPLVRLFNFLRE